MFNPPRTIQQATKRLYGPDPGEPYDICRCAWDVIDPHFGSRQCFNRRGHGPAGLYCRRHAVAEPVQAKVSGSKEHLEWASKFLGI